MSGNPTGSNVVPMPKAPAPATAPPMPMPSMWGGGGSPPWGPGCCPPGGMDALLQCYCDVQAATKFICSVMVTCIQTNPAVTAAIIAAIEASGSSLPLIGVTNGSDAQPGQVGEWVQFSQNFNYTAAAQTQTLTLGVLNPGDWDCWLYASGFAGTYNDCNFELNPVPPGFAGDMGAGNVSLSGPVSVTIPSTTVRASITAPSLIAVQIQTNEFNQTSGASSGNMTFRARRVR